MRFIISFSIDGEHYCNLLKKLWPKGCTYLSHIFAKYSILLSMTFIHHELIWIILWITLWPTFIYLYIYIYTWIWICLKHRKVRIGPYSNGFILIYSGWSAFLSSKFMYDILVLYPLLTIWYCTIIICFLRKSLNN